MKTFVISLERVPERRVAISASLQQYGVDFELFPAVWGADIDRSAPEIFDGDSFVIHNNCLSKTTIKGKLTDGELGCALSHLRLYQKIVQDNLPGAIVLEDDFEAYNDFTAVFEAILAQVPEAELINGRTWSHMGLRQGWFNPRHRVTVAGKEYTFVRAGIPGLDWFLNRRRRMESTRCYYISQQGCKRLLSLGYPVRMESDRLAGMIAYTKLKAYIVKPFLSVTDSKFASMIGGGRSQKAV